MCFLPSFFLCAFFAQAVFAQNLTENGQKPMPNMRGQLSNSERIVTSKSLPGEPKVEYIRIEDDSVRIDELRVGGQTQTIEVQPKSGLPAYQISPAGGAKSSPSQRDLPASAQGVRTWNILSF